MGRKQNANLNIVPLGTKYDFRDSIFQTNPSPARDQNMGRKQNANLNIVPLGTKYDIRDYILKIKAKFRHKIQHQKHIPYLTARWSLRLRRCGGTMSLGTK